MRTTLRRLLACLMAFGLLLTGAVAETADGLDYTVEEKLVKQIQAGSGFQGTLTLESTAVEGRESEAWTTIKPLTVDVGYIYVREDTAKNTKPENRLSFSFVDGEKTLGTAELSLNDGLLALRSSLLGDGWYTLDESAAAGSLSGGDATEGMIGQEAQSFYSQTALPGLAAFTVGLIGHIGETDDSKWTELLDPYTTKIDLWLEGYRQDAILGKLDDGTTTMEIDYTVPASAVKAQLKQMVMDLLADDSMLSALSAILPDEDLKTYLDPQQQNYYFYTIEELPLKGDLELSRTVSLMGETLALSISLPLYDSVGGEATLLYRRSQGEGDLPENNTIELTSDEKLVRLNYQTYKTLTGTTVYQGTLLRQMQGAEAFEVGADAQPNTQKTFSAAFTLSTQKTEDAKNPGSNSLNRMLSFTLSPEYTPEDSTDETAAPTEEQKAEYVVFSPVEMVLDSTFTSGQAKNAATSVDATLTISGDDMPQTITLSFSGKTTGKWTPDAVDAQTATSLDGMNQTALSTLLAQAAVKGGLLLLPYVGMPTGDTTTEATETPEGNAGTTPENSAAPTPTGIPTLAPTATGAETTAQATETATVAPDTSVGPTESPNAAVMDAPTPAESPAS
ncbi:MAG: hypothetical protein PHY64_06120 [Eubacteriales bacterium]|nr:hypothetical protein [Eubacteriales bacterium]